MTSLSEMPEDVIYRISSSLTNKDVTRVGVLSKEYRKLMRKRPTLVFDCTKTNCRGLNQLRTLDRYREEIRCIHASLVRYCEENIDLETFIFRADWWRSSKLGAEDFELYNNCITLALQKGIRNLNLSTWDGYVLHVPAVMEPLVQFSARYCRLQVAEGLVRWSNLKRLCLINAFLGSEAMFDSIIRGCPLLEILEMDFNYEGKLPNLNFRVANLHCLKKVRARLGLTDSFQVTGVPNLEYLACRFKISRPADWLKQPEQYSNLTTLSLFNVRIGQDFFLHLAHIVPKLESLSLKCNSSLQRIQISSRTLKKIHLAYINELQDAQFDVPSIAVFKFRMRYKDRMPKLSFTGNSGRWISRLRIRCRAYINTGWFIELKDMILTAMKGSETFLSIDFFGKVQFDLPDYDSMLFPGVLEIHEFYINSVHEGKFSSSSIHAALDGIFSICHPRTTTFRNWSFYNYEHPRLMHNFLLGISKSHCSCECVWNVTGIKLFRHAKFQNSVISSDSYFYKEGGGLELLPEASDCNKYVELLKVHGKNAMIISEFYLEWRTCGMHTSRMLQLPSPSI